MYCTWCFGWDSKIKFMKNLDNSQILKWQNPGFANCLIVWNFLEEKLLQVDHSSLSHYGERLILNICMTFHHPFKSTILLMSWCWMHTKHHQSMYPQLMWQWLTATVIQNLSGKVLPFQIVFTGKTEKCLPENARGEESFLFLFNGKDWSSEGELLSLINKIIAQYIENIKKELQAPNGQNLFLSGMYLKPKVLQEYKRG